MDIEKYVRAYDRRNPGASGQQLQGGGNGGSREKSYVPSESNFAATTRGIVIIVVVVISIISLAGTVVYTRRRYLENVQRRQGGEKEVLRDPDEDAVRIKSHKL